MKKASQHFKFVSLLSFYDEKEMWISCWHLHAILDQNFHLKDSGNLPILIMEHLNREFCLSLYINGRLTALKPIVRIVLRGIYLAISVFGITYEIMTAEEVRWPLIGGYGLVIVITLYALLKGREQSDDVA